MDKRFRKLSLNKQKDMEMEASSDVDLEVDSVLVDFSLDLTTVGRHGQCSTDDSFADVISNTSSEINKSLNIRHHLAKAREGLVFAGTSRILPPYCRIITTCNPDLIEKDIYDGFKELWDAKCETLRTELLGEMVKYLDDKILELNRKMAETQKNAFQTIGVLLKGSGEARTELSNRIKSAKEHYDKELLVFKTNIRSKSTAPVKSDNASGGNNQGGSTSSENLRDEGHRGYRRNDYEHEGHRGFGNRRNDFFEGARGDRYHSNSFRGASRGNRGGKHHTHRGRPY